MSLQIGSHWQGGNPPFMQQGQVDWVAFGNTIWTASSAVLQRFAAAGIQPVTYGAGIVLSSQMHLDRVGQSRMEKAIDSLKSSFGYQKLLWFGFGYQSFVGTMAETVVGIKCVAVCACLAEAHSEELAAWILAELWHISGFPEHYEPSHSQLLALVKASAGVVARTEFSQTLDLMLGNQLWSEPVASSDGSSMRDTDKIETSNAKDIAQALHYLFKISRGEVDHMVVIGGSECAFVAALAHWLLNLKVLVRSNAGETIFENLQGKTNQKIIVQYGEVTNDSLQVASTTFVLGNCREVFDRIPEPEEYNLVVRTSWDGCLSRVFGQKFKTLSKMPNVLGDYLGSAARIYRALANGENNTGGISRLFYRNFAESSFGLGFVETVISTFPELCRLDGLFDRMQHAVDFSFDQAVRTVEQCITGLEALCDCEHCSSAQDSSITPNTQSRMCLVGVAYAIRRISVVMSIVVQDPEGPRLLPAISGIYMLSAMGKTSEPANSIQTLSLVICPTGKSSDNRGWTRDNFYLNALGLIYDSSSPMFPMDFYRHYLESACLLFQGSVVRARGMKAGDQKTCTAISRRGVCCYMGALTGLSCQAESLCRVHVLAGQIYCKYRRYDTVVDDDIVGSQVRGAESLEPAVLKAPAITLPDAMPDPGITKVEALATEKGVQTAISCIYRVMVSNTSVYISPGELTDSVLQSTGLIACEGRGCRDRLAFPCHPVEAGWRVSSGSKGSVSLTYHSGIACCLWTYENDAARCVAALCQVRHSSRSVLIRRHECLPCCTKSILQDLGKIVDAGDIVDTTKSHQLNRKDIVVHII